MKKKIMLSIVMAIFLMNIVGVFALEMQVEATTIRQSVSTKLITNNQPPDKPATPDGPTGGIFFHRVLVGSEYVYSTTTSDPDGDQVYYQWDWGDEISEWDGPYDSGEGITGKHTWTESGTYDVRVKAKDVNGAESDWSDPLTVTVSVRLFNRITSPVVKNYNIGIRLI